MAVFILRIGLFEIGYDREYGIDHRAGWYVAWDGSMCCQFIGNPIAALIEARPHISLIRKHRQENP